MQEELWLLPEKAVWWPKEKILLIADMHLGKSAHFRKNGIPVPSFVFEKTLQKLEKLYEALKPAKIIFLGDLVHSSHNKEFQLLHEFLSAHHCEYILVTGNHDIYSREQLKKLPLNIHPNDFEIVPFIFSHEITESKYLYNISGHFHPAIIISGKAKQSLRLECFIFSGHHAILPAFGGFTGNAIMEPKTSDKVFVIAGSEVLKVG
jgi:uncharacterized protein